MSESLYDKALRLLGREVKKSADPDDADSRISDEAEPNDKKLEEAGKEAAAGAPAEGGEPGGVPANPGEGEEGGEGHAEPDADNEGGPSDHDADNEGEEGEGFDEHGNDDMDEDEIRELRKAFGLTDFDDVKDTKKSADISGMLGQILAHMQKTDAYMQGLNKELADLKAKHSSGKGDEDLRVAMKAVDTKVDALQRLLENLPRTAPAAAQPKAFQKAMNPGPAEQKLTLTDVTNLAMTGKISASEAARLTRQINHNTPATAGF